MDPLGLWDALRLGVVGKSSPLDLLTKQFRPGRYEPPAFALELAFKDVRLRPSPSHPVANLSHERANTRPVLGGLINVYERAA